MQGQGIGVDPVVIAAGISVVMVTVVIIWAVRYRKAGPDEVLVISGRKNVGVGPDGRRRVTGNRYVSGGGTFVWPVIETVRKLSLSAVECELEVREVATKQGPPLVVIAAAQVRIPKDSPSIERAAEQFLSGGEDAVVRTSRLIVEDGLRSVLGRLSHAEIEERRPALSSEVRNAAAGDLARAGLEFVSLTIREIRGL